MCVVSCTHTYIIHKNHYLISANVIVIFIYLRACKLLCGCILTYSRDAMVFVMRLTSLQMTEGKQSIIRFETEIIKESGFRWMRWIELVVGRYLTRRSKEIPVTFSRLWQIHKRESSRRSKSTRWISSIDFPVSARIRPHYDAGLTSDLLGNHASRPFAHEVERWCRVFGQLGPRATHAYCHSRQRTRVGPSDPYGAVSSQVTSYVREKESVLSERPNFIHLRIQSSGRARAFTCVSIIGLRYRWRYTLLASSFKTPLTSCKIDREYDRS